MRIKVLSAGDSIRRATFKFLWSNDMLPSLMVSQTCELSTAVLQAGGPGFKAHFSHKEFKQA